MGSGDSAGARVQLVDKGHEFVGHEPRNRNTRGMLMSVVSMLAMDGVVEPSGGVVQERDHGVGDLADRCSQ